MTTIEDLISELEDMLESSLRLPMSGGKVLVKVKDIQRTLEDIRLNLPQEIVSAQKIMSDRNHIIEQAKNEAETMIRISEEKIKAMVEKSEIVKAAQNTAQQIVKDAKEKSKEMKDSANEYVEEMMKRLDQTMSANLAEIKKARQMLRPSSDDFNN